MSNTTLEINEMFTLSPVEENLETKRKVYKCVSCDKQFFTSDNLISHVSLEHTDKHVCDICDAIFPQKRFLFKHKLHKHKNENAFKCDKCGKTFPEQSLLKMHFESSHGDQQNFKCNLCDTSFDSKVKLYHHRMRVHVKEKIMHVIFVTEVTNTGMN